MKTESLRHDWLKIVAAQPAKGPVKKNPQEIERAYQTADFFTDLLYKYIDPDNKDPAKREAHRAVMRSDLARGSGFPPSEGRREMLDAMLNKQLCDLPPVQGRQPG